MKQLQEQVHMCSMASSHMSRLYQAVVMARDELRMTRDEFRRNVARRPDYYRPVAYLLDYEEFWTVE